MQTRIISAFPGTGKSYYHKINPDTTLDSDSSEFSWIVIDGQKIRNPDFPNNYIRHIQDNIGSYEFIFVSSHKEVREALLANCIFFYIMYPNGNFKEEYMRRYKERGSDEAFIKLIDTNWEAWLHELSFEHDGCKNVWGTWSVEKEIDHIIRVAGGER